MSNWKCPKCGNEEWASSYTFSYCGNCGSVIREGESAGPDTSVVADQGPREKAPATFEEAIDAILAEMRAVMIERQKKYGPDNIRRLGIIGVLDRAMHDKMERLRRYYNREDLRIRCYEAGMPQEVIDRYLPALSGDYDDEALEDAHVDAANYVGIIALMLRRGWWGLPMAEEKAN